MSEGKTFLTTTPGTMMEFTVKRRKRPCWRCRTYRRNRMHWNCRPAPKLATYVGPAK